METSSIKLEMINKLAEKRRNDNQENLTKKYKQVGDYHKGVYEIWGNVSPWTKSAFNLNSEVMVVAQDWTSEEVIIKPPKNLDLSYDPDLPTNKNLQFLLGKYLNLSFSDIYATNLFVFVKPGNLSSRIPLSDLIYSATNYTIPEINIINPKLVICLGSSTYKALSRAQGINNVDFKNSIDNPIILNGKCIVGVPHTGGLGTRNAGGMENVKKIWQKLSEIINS